jgi:hypothetical protein
MKKQREEEQKIKDILKEKGFDGKISVTVKKPQTPWPKVIDTGNRQLHGP